jgi:hypothetical protein
MASLDWRIKGINGDQIANEIAATGQVWALLEAR